MPPMTVKQWENLFELVRRKRGAHSFIENCPGSEETCWWCGKPDEDPIHFLDAILDGRIGG